ncbi:3476_t:CDS:2, partial [Gigaspora margarita]
MALGFFVIVDNNNRSRLVEQALMSDETAERVTPLTIITDNDLAINAMITNVLPNNSVNGSTSLINLARHIDEQINRASTYVQYKNWVHSITGSILTQASSEFSPDIDLWISTYLIPASLSMQHDMTEQSDTTEALNVFVEDAMDAPAILIQELIPSSEIEFVSQQHPFIIGLDNNSNSDTSVQQSFPDLSFNSPNISFDDVHTKINYQVNVRIQDNESEPISSCSSSDDFVAVEDPIVSTKRGAPRKKRLKESYEFESKNKSNARQYSKMSKARKPTQCQQCQNTGHNKASCEAWH